MKQRRIYRILRALSGDERKDFLKFLRSPFHNKKNEVTRIFELMQKTVLKPGSGDMSVEEFHALWRPGKLFDSNYLNSRLSMLRKQLDLYLEQTELQQRELLRHRMLLSAYQRLGLYDEIPQLYHRMRKKVDQQEVRSALYYADAFELDFAMGGYFFSKDRKADDFEDFFDRVSRYSDQYYALRKLQMGCGIRSYNQAHGTQHHVSFLGRVLKETEQHADASNPMLLCYVDLFQLADRLHDEQRFLRVKTRLLQHSSTFPETDSRTLYELMLNFCYQHINSGKADYLYHAEELFDKLLSTGLILVGDRLDPGHFKNIVTLKCVSGKLKEAEQFVASYKGRLTGDQEMYVEAYGSGEIAFYKGDFEQCWRLMETAIGNRDDLYYSPNSRTYQLECLVEEYMAAPGMRNEERMTSALQNFRQYIDRNQHKYGARNRQQYQYFVQLARKIVQQLIKPGMGDKNGWFSIRKEVDTMVPLTISSRRWFLSVIDRVAK